MSKRLAILEILRSNPEIGVKVKVIIDGEGAYVFDGNDIVASNDERECTIEGTATTFEAVIQGELSPTSAFFEGQIKVAGDMSVALTLGNLLTNQ